MSIGARLPVHFGEPRSVIIRGPAAAAIGMGFPCDSWITGSEERKGEAPAACEHWSGEPGWECRLATQRIRFRPWSAQHGLRRPIRPETTVTDELTSGVRRYCQAIFQDNRQLCNWAGQVSNWWRGGGRSLIAAAQRRALPRLACALPTDRKQPVAGETSKLTECARDHGLINNRRARKHPKPRPALTGGGEVAICGETAWAFQSAPDLVGRGKAAS